MFYEAFILLALAIQISATPLPAIFEKKGPPRPSTLCNIDNRPPPNIEPVRINLQNYPRRRFTSPPDTNTVPWITAAQGDATRQFQFRAYEVSSSTTGFVGVVLESQVLGPADAYVLFHRTATSRDGNTGNPGLAFSLSAAAMSNGAAQVLSIDNADQAADVEFFASGNWGMCIHVKKNATYAN